MQAPQSCKGNNGDVDLPYGAPEFVGMGFMTVCLMVLIEIVGAPFWKNCSCVLALLLAYFVAMGMTYTAADGTAQKYVTFKFTKKSLEKPITFFWVETFPYGFEPSAILPLITAFFVSSAETVGDIGATCDASDIPAIGPDADTRVQGGLLSDGVNSFLAALFTTSPNTTYSQNSGVIAITRCASRSAGLACAFWLIALGLIGPLGGFCSDIPACVLGGMVTFLFANVMVSGIQIISGIGVGRRNRIILSFALGIGLGVGMQPNFIDGGGGKAFMAELYQMNIGFYPRKLACVPGTEVMVTVGNPSNPGPTLDWVLKCDFDKGLKGLRDSVVLFLKTPYCIGTVTALILNLLLPMDELEKAKNAKMKGTTAPTESAAA
jgi:NCS2 family nucleobase:cation symporter-2